MKKLLLGLCLLFTSFFSHAQTQGLENIIVEKYYVSNLADSLGASGFGDELPVGSVTYRIYADMLPGYKFQAAYGVPTHNLVLSTTSSFYNNTDRGHEIPSFSKANAAQHTTMLDSYFSVGAACANSAGPIYNYGILKSEDGIAGGANIVNANGILQNNDPSAGIPLTTADGFYGVSTPVVTSVSFVNMATQQGDFDGGPSSNGFVTNNASWASLTGATGPTASNRVLIGQFTTNGCFHFELNIQIGTPTGGIQNYVSGNATGNEIYFPACTYPLVSGISTSTGSNVLSCPASTLTLVATGGGTYLWDNSSTNANRTVTSAGTYTVVVDGGNGCTSSASIAVTSSTDVTNPTIYLQNSATLSGITGPSTSQTPYLQPLKPGVQFRSILTANESVGGYKLSGIPDGLGAFDNGNGTFTLLVNHEIPNTAGVVRAHGSIGAFVSKWIINKSNLSVVSGSDLMQQVYLWNGSAHVLAGPGTAAFSRFCSADLPPVSAFYNINTGKGTTERIFMNGEESGTEGRAVGHIATGPNSGKSYQLPYLGKFSWENAVAAPSTGDSTIVAGTDDGTGGQVYFYVGTKTTIGNEIDKAGLNNGKLFGVIVSGFSVERINATTINNPPAPNTPFSLVDLGNVSNITGAVLNSNSNTAGVSQFSRPEDGAWDPSNPNDFYFATTDQIDQVNDGVGTQIGRSRVWRLRFNNVASPSLGGTITAVLDGTEGQNMIDNIGFDNFGHLILQEDVGNQQHNGKIWQYNVATDQLTLIAKHDQARFGNIGIPATAPYNQDEESSGVIDASSILGPGMFLAVDQAHYNTGIPADVYEGGQLLAFFNPESYGSGEALDTVKVYATTGCSATGVNLGTPATADNCSVASVTNNAPVTFPLGNTNVTWTVTDGSSNTATATQVVMVLDTFPPASITGNLVICSGGSTTLSVGAYASYNWSTGASTQSISTNTGGTYTVTVTTSGGCTSSASATVTAASELELNGASTTDIQCNGDADGQIDLSTAVSGGTTPYSYLWSNGQTTDIISGLSGGTYSVTITDAGGCTLTASYTVSEPTAVVGTFTQVNINCNGGSNGSIDLTVTGGNAPYTFDWSNGSTTEDLSGLSAGVYVVAINDAFLCPNIQTITITEPSVLVASESHTAIACFGGTSSVTISAIGGTPPYSGIGNFTQSAGTQSYTVTDANGCTSSVSVVITEPAQLVAAESHTAILCFGGNSSVTISATGGTSPYTGTGIFTQAAGTQVYTVTDANGCTSVVTVIVSQPAQLTVTANAGAAGCNGNAGSVLTTVNGGTSPYTYSWSNGATTSSLSGLAAGTYTVTVSDANGCTATAQATVAVSATIVVTGTTTNLNCRGVSTGSIVTNVSGGTSPYTYLWNNGNTNANRSNQAAGTYTVTVTDANGCTKTASFTLTQPATNLLANTNQTNVRCGGASSGTVTVSPIGGTAPYTFSWNTIPVKTTATITGLSAGVYSCTYTDAIGCSKVVTITITAPAPLTGFQTQTNVTFPGGNNGTAGVIPGGGTPAYTYNWNTVPVKTTASVTGLTAGTYKVTVTDSRGCTLKLTYIITEPSAKESIVNSGSAGEWNVSVFPNPSTGFVNVIFGAEANEQFNVMLTDLTGRIVYEKNSTGEQGENLLSYDFNSLAKGVYMMKITKGNQQNMTKIVLQ